MFGNNSNNYNASVWNDWNKVARRPFGWYNKDGKLKGMNSANLKNILTNPVTLNKIFLSNLDKMYIDQNSGTRYLYTKGNLGAIFRNSNGKNPITKNPMSPRRLPQNIKNAIISSVMANRAKNSAAIRNKESRMNAKNLAARENAARKIQKFARSKVLPKPFERSPGWFRKAKFRDVSSGIPGYNALGYVRNKSYIKKAGELIKKNPKFKHGDVVFIGNFARRHPRTGYYMVVPSESGIEPIGGGYLGCKGGRLPEVYECVQDSNLDISSKYGLELDFSVCTIDIINHMWGFFS